MSSLTYGESHTLVGNVSNVARNTTTVRGNPSRQYVVQVIVIRGTLMPKYRTVLKKIYFMAYYAYFVLTI